MWRKMAILFVMSLHPFVVNFTSSSISSALPIYASTPALGLPPPPFSRLTYFVAVNILMLGASNIWWVPLANTFGRRPIILVSLLILVFSSMWAGLATTFNGLLGARLLMGIGGGSADSVSPDVVGEIFFVHQRGRAMVRSFLSLTKCNTNKAFSGYLHCLSIARVPSWCDRWRLHRRKHESRVAPLDERRPFSHHIRSLPCNSSRNAL